jgi:hypothetical protein
MKKNKNEKKKKNKDMTREFNMIASTASPGFGKRVRIDDATADDAATRAATRPAFDEALWKRLVGMNLDDAHADKPLSKRLAEEHKWSESDTRRAMDEYKRFLYLAVRAGHEVTPSRPVDLVWHEHLMHTKHYWDVMCREVLQRDLDHNPGTGTAADDDRLMGQYQQTLDSYRAAFGFDPPADLWPAPMNRKPTAISAVIAGVFAIGLVTGFANRMIPLIMFSVFGLIVTLAVRYSRPNKSAGGCGSGCGSGGIGDSGCADGGGGDGGGDGGGCGGGGD